MNGNLLIVEDDNTMRETLVEIFRNQGITTFESSTCQSGFDTLRSQKIDVMLLDMNLPDMTGLSFWDKTREMDDRPLCIFMTAYPEVKAAVSAMKDGAFDYINKPFELDELRLIVDKAFEMRRLRSAVQSLQYERSMTRHSLGMIGQSDAIKRVQEQIQQVALADTVPVLILGESGTGKELVADAIHNLSPRRENPLLRINCSAIPEQLLESELFGHEKGSFTDAKQSKKGIFELANNGTIFLDEIGDLNLPLQPKLLRVLESKTLHKVGGTKDIPIDVRVISATNKSLQQKIWDGSFRSDLLYRLNVFTINLPSLKERVDDIPLLARHFLQNARDNIKKDIKDISNDAVEYLKEYSWPGNIRELKNVVERACILTKSDRITRQDLSLEFAQSNDESFQRPVFSIYNRWIPIEQLELSYIKSAMAHFGGNKSETARHLGISRVTLREKLRKITQD
ncbi:MAG: sigma-54-dependent Fis family transcriptional regulator [Nitrospinae bacterium]|nr:sigma-54-dependent Fis family transcriptional regulator [Nitrospinota bacterium]